MVKRLVLAILILLTLGLVACIIDNHDDYIRRNVTLREEAFAKAEAAIPQPQPNNFLARKMLVKYVERQDVPSHLFYVYVVAPMGNIVGYYTAQAAPVNINAFLSPTEKIFYSEHGNLVLTAPSLDGIYYGGAGSSASADGWFFFDAATDALIIIYAGQFTLFVSDYQLALDAKPIQVKAK